MEITHIPRGEFVEVLASGRLDERWTSHLSKALDEVIREGFHRIHLNLSAVSYLSSAGIQLLIGFHKKLDQIGGSFGVTEPSDMVRKVLDLTRLSPVLILDHGAHAPAVKALAPEARRMERPGATFEVFSLAPGAAFQCRAIGNPRLLAGCEYRERHARTIPFTSDMLGLGLGAFGSGFEDCRNRYGEFLAVAGAAAYLPTDGSSVPDYLVSVGRLVPEISILHGLVCQGTFASLARFEASKESRVITLAEVARTALEIADSDAAAIVMVAETAGLVGATLRKSPASGPPAAPELFSHPEIRNWISFTADPAYAGSLCIIVGVAARASMPGLDPLLRPVGTAEWPAGHFHAAVFHYQPVRKGEIQLDATVNALMPQGLQAMLHLLADHRETAGAGESEWIRGVCWIGPIREIAAEVA
jgi:anti-anti-sigma factor